MQINNNLNSMVQLEKKLEQSADALSKLTLDNPQTNQNSQKDIQKDTQPENQNRQNTEIVQEMVKQIEIPIAYSANGQVISTQNAIAQATLDIKA